MGIFDGWTIVSDIDGTLLANGAMQVSEANKRAIEYWRKEGGIFTLATGRYLGSTLPISKDLDLPVPFIYNNGASIYDPLENDFPALITLGDGILPVISDLLSQFPNCGIAGYSKDSFCLIRENPSMRRHLIRQGITPNRPDNLESSALFCKILITVEAAEIEMLKAALQTKAYFSKFHFAQSTPEFYEITSIGATKGTLLPALCALLDRVPAHLITIGDNENDISLLQSAPFSFAVHNATRPAKDAARFVTSKRGDIEPAITEVITTMERIIRNGEI